MISSRTTNIMYILSNFCKIFYKSVTCNGVFFGIRHLQPKTSILPCYQCSQIQSQCQCNIHMFSYTNTSQIQNWMCSIDISSSSCTGVWILGLYSLNVKNYFTTHIITKSLYFEFVNVYNCFFYSLVSFYIYFSSSCTIHRTKSEVSL